MSEVRVDVAAQVGLDVRAGGRPVQLRLAPVLGVLAEGRRVVGVDEVAADDVGRDGGEEPLGVDPTGESPFALLALGIAPPGVPGDAAVALAALDAAHGSGLRGFVILVLGGEPARTSPGS